MKNVVIDKKTQALRCEQCGQAPEDHIYGEYPCSACGSPTLHDEPLSYSALCGGVEEGVEEKVRHEN